MKHVSVVQHTQSEWLGAIEDHLEGRGIRFSYFRPFTTGGQVPNVMTLGEGLVMLGGGPWGAATEGHLLPSLDAEVRLARACLMMGKPVIGFGLGAQVLALAADGGADQAPLVLEVATVRRATPDALAGYLPETFPSVVYMRDWPRPPDYAQVLARDEAGRPAVFQIGTNAFGFAGHPGVRPAMIEDLVMEFEEAPANCAAGLPLVREKARAVEDALVPIMTGLVSMTGWMGG
jgi:GMP synthase-like glutamine amidotransferase